MTGVMEPEPSRRIHPPIKWQRRWLCKLGKHSYAKSRIYIPPSRWKVQMLFCRRCAHVEAIAAFEDSR